MDSSGERNCIHTQEKNFGGQVGKPGNQVLKTYFEEIGEYFFVDYRSTRGQRERKQGGLKRRQGRRWRKRTKRKTESDDFFICHRNIFY